MTSLHTSTFWYLACVEGCRTSSLGSGNTGGLLHWDCTQHGTTNGLQYSIVNFAIAKIAHRITTLSDWDFAVNHQDPYSSLLDTKTVLENNFTSPTNESFTHIFVNVPLTLTQFLC